MERARGNAVVWIKEAELADSLGVQAVLMAVQAMACLNMVLIGLLAMRR
jgi:hypothetical protein